MEENIRKQLKALLQQEVVLATGCTEPGAVALCVSKACETLGREPESLDLHLSKNVFKNAMGVGIPGTGMIGLPIAVSLAVVAGDSRRGLEILTVPAEKVEKAKAWLANNAGRISIGVKNQSDKLYIECTCSAGNDSATAIISQRHTHFVKVSRNGEVVYDGSALSPNVDAPAQEECGSDIALTARLVYDYATTAPIEELEFIKETVKYNDVAATEGLKGYGLKTGKILMENAEGDIVHTVVARTVAASDARMDGCTLPVYSNSGSGNQGIACTLPVYNYGKAKGCTDEQITRALVLNHLMSIYIKQGIGRLSALCGIVNASIGVACGIVFLHGGSFEQICFAIKNMINTIAGMVCDGAKPSCALKMSTGLYSAFVSAELAYHDCVVDATDGLSESDVDCSIHNLGRLGHDGMDQVDDTVLDIMTHKQ
ncbi:MAG: serine dehydratase subunit alpha family protein [Bacteroidales bacterium]|nr:serine dehydratase subunit alpha family protein [Bacteroidales bacterium]